jgi:hypothetical protein
LWENLWDDVIGSVEGKFQKGYGLWENQVKVPVVYRQKGPKASQAVGKPGKSACCLSTERSKRVICCGNAR